LGVPLSPAYALAGLGEIAANQGDSARAAALIGEALAVAWAQGAQQLIVEDLDKLADLAAKAGQPALATRLLGAAAALHDALDISVWASDRPYYEGIVAAVRPLGEEAFAAAWEAGRGLPMEQAVTEALALADELAASSGS
jgi:hypothetical protein